MGRTPKPPLPKVRADQTSAATDAIPDDNRPSIQLPRDRNLSGRQRNSKRPEFLQGVRTAPRSCSSNLETLPHIPGIFIPAIRLAKLGLPIDLNILRICAYCRSRLFTSGTLVPEPRAIRLRREPLMAS
jgi:hypothetical protein